MDARENADANSMFVVKQYSDIPSNPYDDIVLALTPGELLTPLTNGGGMQDYRAAINSKFNIIKSAVVGNAVQSRISDVACVAGSCTPTFGTCAVTTPCGIPFFRYTLATADAAPNTIPAVLSLQAPIKNDPWGNPIQYVVTTPTIIPTAPSAAVAFTLTSWGPDGVAGNIDDIGTTIYVGELQTQFSKY